LRASADERFRAKEQELESQLRTTEDKLTALQARRNDRSAVILTPEQEQEIARFQQEKLKIRKDLRSVRAGLDADITHLGSTIKVLNIIVVPLIFALAALAIGLHRRRRTPVASTTVAEKTS